MDDWLLGDKFCGSVGDYQILGTVWTGDFRLVGRPTSGGCLWFCSKQGNDDCLQEREIKGKNYTIRWGDGIIRLDKIIY